MCDNDGETSSKGKLGWKVRQKYKNSVHVQMF